MHMCVFVKYINLRPQYMYIYGDVNFMEWLHFRICMRELVSPQYECEKKSIHFEVHEYTNYSEALHVKQLVQKSTP